MQGSTKDDPSIPNESHILRRISPKMVVEDKNAGVLRPSSQAYNDSSTSPMSVNLSCVMDESRRPYEDSLNNYPTAFLAKIEVRVVREVCGLGVIKDPLPEEPAHGLVTGTKTRSVRKKLSSNSIWIIDPNNL